ncbi:hypothetical protein [Nocardia fluminea]|nr:hypothetical protein [Nocardia fluminea]
MSTPAAEVPRPRILVDTNVWRYLIDRDGVEAINRAARDGRGKMIACPAVLYEILRLEDVELRHSLVKAICRSRWVRLMPEVFEESSELRVEIARLRSRWLLSHPDMRTFRALDNDWRGPRGVWWRARVDPAEAAAVLREVEGNFLVRSRDDAKGLRDQIGAITNFDKVTLDRWTTTFPLNPGGWDGDPVETWRAETMRYYIEALLRPGSAQSSAAREWLEPWVDLAAMRRELPSFVRLFLYETEPARLPRSWLRWAIQVLQGTRTTSPGTPVDNQIASYLVEADIFVTADKAFAAIVQRVVDEGVIDIATPVLVSADTCVSSLERLLSS